MKFPHSIAIEGIDGSGKGTQAHILAERIAKMNRSLSPGNMTAKVVSFPRYDTHHGRLVKGYLHGELGGDPTTISPWLASNLYMLDRASYYKETRGAKYEESEVVVFDRHMGSNMAHQGAKFEAKVDREAFYDWCLQTEVMCGVEVPALTIYLRSTPVVANTAIQGRESLDGHETNLPYLERTRAAYDEVAEYFDWEVVECIDSSTGQMRRIDDIAAEIFFIVVTAGGTKNV